MGHKQTPNRLKTDNTTASNFANASLRQKRSKSWDMRYHWLRERTAQEQFNFFGDHGHNNEADFTTKFHPPGHTLKMREQYLRKIHNLNQFLNHIFTLPFHDRREVVFIPSGLSGDRLKPLNMVHAQNR